MKKNRMMRLASILLVCVLLSTSVISGTFAKYTTTATANDSARVAKWGVDVIAYSNEVFTPTYAAEATGVSGNSVVAATNDNDTQDDVLAPGTSGTLGTVEISGKPEVMVDVKVDVDLDISNWVVPTDENYFPVVIKVNGTAVTYAVDDDASDIECAVEDAVIKAVLGNVNPSDNGTDAENGRTCTKQYAANNDFGVAGTTDVTVTWEWPFENGVAGQTNVKDTALGDANTAATITYKYTVTVTQVN